MPDRSDRSTRRQPDYAKLIFGKWEVTKAAPGTVPECAIIEFKKGREAEGVAQESLREAYGRDSVHGQPLLLARRLIEAGTAGVHRG
jgi:hypothetical protein